MSAPTPPAPPPPGPSGVGDFESEPVTTGLPDCAPTGVGSAALTETSAMPRCEAASIEAWSDEIEAPDEGQQTWRRTVILAFAVAFVGVAVGAAMWFGHSSTRVPQVEATSSLPTSTSVPQLEATSSPPTPNVESRAPAPPPTFGAPPAQTEAPQPQLANGYTVYDQMFVAKLLGAGWNITNPESAKAVLEYAHIVCEALRGDVPMDVVYQGLVDKANMPIGQAKAFTTTAQMTYMDCQ